MPRMSLVALALTAFALGAGSAGATTDPSLRVTGTVTALSAGSLTITAEGGQTMVFRLVATTTYSKDGQAASEAALQAGEHVKVKYHQEPNGSLKAKAVEVETQAGGASAPLRTRGTVTSVAADTLVITEEGSGKQLSFRLSATALYLKEGKPAIEVDLRAGEYVKVKYRVEADGSLKAGKVEIEQRARAVAFQLEGIDVGGSGTTLLVRVASLRENGAAVAGSRRTVGVRLAAGATVLLNNRKARLGALARGDRLHVSGTVSGGVLTAKRIVAQRTARRK